MEIGFTVKYDICWTDYEGCLIPFSIAFDGEKYHLHNSEFDIDLIGEIEHVRCEGYKFFNDEGGWPELVYFNKHEAFAELGAMEIRRHINANANRLRTYLEGKKKIVNLRIEGNYVNYDQKTYIMYDPYYELFKIGKSVNPESRRKSLANPDIKLIAVHPQDIEVKLHNEYSGFRKFGEWFDLGLQLAHEIIEKYSFDTTEYVKQRKKDGTFQLEDLIK